MHLGIELLYITYFGGHIFERITVSVVEMKKDTQKNNVLYDQYGDYEYMRQSYIFGNSFSTAISFLFIVSFLCHIYHTYTDLI